MFTRANSNTLKAKHAIAAVGEKAFLEPQYARRAGAWLTSSRYGSEYQNTLNNIKTEKSQALVTREFELNTLNAKKGRDIIKSKLSTVKRDLMDAANSVKNYKQYDHKDFNDICPGNVEVCKSVIKFANNQSSTVRLR
jgi:hypothetical protein